MPANSTAATANRVERVSVLAKSRVAQRLVTSRPSTNDKIESGKTSRKNRGSTGRWRTTRKIANITIGSASASIRVQLRLKRTTKPATGTARNGEAAKSNGVENPAASPRRMSWRNSGEDKEVNPAEGSEYVVFMTT